MTGYIDNRPVEYRNTIRVRHAKKEWGFYNRVMFVWLDTNEHGSMGSAEWAKRVKDQPTTEKARVL